MGWKNHNTKALSLHECVYYGLSKSLKKQAGDSGGLAFHLTVSSSLETFYLQVQDVKQRYGLRHHLSVTHICALIPTQTTQGFTPRPKWDKPQRGLTKSGLLKTKEPFRWEATHLILKGIMEVQIYSLWMKLTQVSAQKAAQKLHTTMCSCTVWFH